MRGIGLKQAELEYSVLGSMLIDDRCFYYGAAFLNEDYFVISDSKELFRILKAKAEEGESVEKGLVEVWLEEELKVDKEQRKRFEAFVSVLIEYAYPQRFQSYCEELQRRYKRRCVAEVAKKLAAGEISEEKAAELLLEREAEGKAITQVDALTEFIKLYEKEDAFPFVPTYYDPLDQKVRFEYLTIVAARPSIGKTVFALSLMKKQAENGHPVLFFSQELPVVEEIQPRLVAMELGVPLDYVKEKWAREEEVLHTVRHLEELPIRYVDSRVTIPQFAALIHANAEWLKGGDKPGIVWVDYLQIFKKHRNFQNQKEFLDYAVEVCVEITKELKIPIVLLAQINREARTGKKLRPTMDQLKGSGDIEQQATNVIVLHRNFEDSPETLEIYIDKSRLKGRSWLTVPFRKGFPDLDGRFSQELKEPQKEEEAPQEVFDDFEF
jgi:replicative DNA helicase